MSLKRKISGALGDVAEGIGARLNGDADRELYRRHYSESSIRERQFYNIGAGAFRHRYWTNVDHPSSWYQSRQDERSMIAWDMLALTPLPIPDASAELVYTSHALEHVSDAAAANMLSESFRVLRPGGTVRLTMPDMGLSFRAYVAGDREFFRSFAMPKDVAFDAVPLHELFLARFATSTTQLWASQGEAPRVDRDAFDAWFQDVEQDEGEHFESAMNQCVTRVSMDIQRENPGNHVNWWTTAKTLRFLREAGFRSARVSAYGQSSCPVLRNTYHFDSTRPTISLYVDAQR